MSRTKQPKPEKTVKAAVKAEAKKEKEPKKKGKQSFFLHFPLICLFRQQNSGSNIQILTFLYRQLST